ncbi:tyrosine-protein phosphatase [Nocardioides sp. WS12]|uniref:tyrosine-protein phosphatase n=1 Tax=Nocardioides sp. WS12 TaxID=2486272 RepID=UPI0015F8D9ED|nr:tyrosine-protein phosphatase [Nocardioides sp. WS12]
MPSETSLPSPRVLSLEGAHNLRDLGGMSTVSGQIVRPGRIFRSDYPLFADLDPGGMTGLGLRSVVDLRRGSEASRECVDWAGHGVAYHRWPLTAGAADSWHARYPAYLTERPETVVGAVREVMRPAGHAVLFHCAAGKDRTGVLAALLLSVLDVPEASIIEDYVLSASSVEPVLTRLLGIDLYADMLAGGAPGDQDPRPEHMAGFLSWLAEAGGAAAWLARHGVQESELAAFRAAMLEG